MARKNLFSGFSTDHMVGLVCSDDGRLVKQLVHWIAKRPDCTINHLLDLAVAPAVTMFLGEPDDSAKLWENDGIIETKFNSLSLKEQIAAIRYAQKEYGEEEMKEALKWFLSWMKAPQNTKCHDLLQIVDDGGGQDYYNEAFLDAFELLADKEGLLK